MFEKHKCFDCDAIATWCYMPKSEYMTLEETYRCDDHVPRGCTCNQDSEPIDGNWDNRDDSNWRMLPEPVDEMGRLYPCCEWCYHKDGYFVNDEDYGFDDDDDEL